MLKCPFMNTPYTPNISHILGALSIYDLEDTVGKELWKYDPNNEKRQRDNYYFFCPEEAYAFIIQTSLRIDVCTPRCARQTRL
jgi:hypothetical protein